MAPLKVFFQDRSPYRSGADRDRTDDLRLAKPALSQLSYSPSGSASESTPDASLTSGPGQT